MHMIKSLEIDDEHADTMFNKAHILEGQGKYEEAIKCYDKLSLIDPENPAPIFNKGAILVLKLGASTRKL